MAHYYTTGAFAKMAHTTIRTIRYYDKQGLLKPTAVNEAGYRMYTDEDFLRLQKILSLKYLGFSLKEIANMTVNDDSRDILSSLKMQVSLVNGKMDHLLQMKKALENSIDIVEKTNEVDWNEILNLIHLSDMEKNLIEQYKNSTNLNIRIALHEKYATNPQGWFPWLYQQISQQGGGRILELGCGNGQLWQKVTPDQLEGKTIWLTDASEGMVKDVKNSMDSWKRRWFRFQVMDCQKIEFPQGSFDCVIANHVLFYVKNISRALEEVRRVLMPRGFFCCSTYGAKHMQEISRLVQEFDSRISLSEVELYRIFGLENGERMLTPYFTKVEKHIYEDSLWVDNPQPLLDYIMSCHGNQSQYLLPRKEEFKEFLAEKIAREGGISITKEAGMFVCRNQG